MSAPDPALVDYYAKYEAVFQKAYPEYFVPMGDLWEMPLWVAHLAGLLERLGVENRFLDLSRTPPTLEAVLDALEPVVDERSMVLFSPLAVNFALTRRVSRRLAERGVRTVIGGNMAPLAEPGDAAQRHLGLASPASLAELLSGAPTVATAPVPGRQTQEVDWTPSYRHLAGYQGRVPLLRINASHGCLYRCSFCGDAWSSQLHEVSLAALRREIAQLFASFPETGFVYIGDKTFGQSRPAMANLETALGEHPARKLIVQTHVLAVTGPVIEAMARLNVHIVELGFESADTEMLKRSGKLSRGLDHYGDVVDRLHAAGFRVVLNILGGLPEETEDSHRLTGEWLSAAADHVWAANLYSFVPYPLTPYFETLRPRIVDWNFEHWREDAPPVYEPFHLSRGRSWHLFLDKVDQMSRVLEVRL